MKEKIVINQLIINMSGKEILIGHLKELFKFDEELMKERLKHCDDCPLGIMTKLGIICNDRKWYNPEKDTLYDYPADGSVNGCGCRMYAKTRLSDSNCVLNKW